MSRSSQGLVGLLLAATLGACSSEVDGGDPGTLTVAKTAANSGDGQAGTAGNALANPLRVFVADGGMLQSGVTVTWATPNGGTFTPATSTTDASGVATTSWTLGAAGGAQTATAAVSGATGSPLTFTASSPAIPTITVGPDGGVQFSPTAITISAGEYVRFVWPSGSSNHNVSPDLGTASALPASPGLPILRDGPYEFNATFPAAGTFRFYCTAHGGNPSAGVVTGMSGTITVN